MISGWFTFKFILENAYGIQCLWIRHVAIELIDGINSILLILSRWKLKPINGILSWTMLLNHLIMSFMFPSKGQNGVAQTSESRYLQHSEFHCIIRVLFVEHTP